MKWPSLPELITAIQEILTIFSEGGPKAIAFIFLLNFVIVVGVAYVIVKFLSKFMQEHNDDKEKALAAKDEIINNARQRSEILNEQYAKLATQSIEREHLVLNEMRELRTLVTLFLTNRSMPVPPPTVISNGQS